MARSTALFDLMNSFQYGLFFNLSDKYWKLPNGIAKLLHVDETGNCWFLFHISSEQATLYEQESPAKIRLYEKGRECYIEANGKALVLTDPQDWLSCPGISYGMAKALRYHGLIVRFKIQQATVTEAGRSSRRNFLQRMADEVSELISGKRIDGKAYPSSILSN